MTESIPYRRTPAVCAYTAFNLKRRGSIAPTSSLALTLLYTFGYVWTTDYARHMQLPEGHSTNQRKFRGSDI
jgi:hypothetical protein